jgi:hypothetical protein
MARSKSWLTDLPFCPSAETNVSDGAVQLGNQSLPGVRTPSPQVYLVTLAVGDEAVHRDAHRVHQHGFKLVAPERRTMRVESDTAHSEHVPDVSPLGRLRLAVVAVRVGVKGVPQRLLQRLEVVLHPDA